MFFQSSIFNFIFIFATLEQTLSFHGIHSATDTSSSDGTEATWRMPTPLSPPPSDRWSLPWSRSEPTANPGPLLVRPRVATSSQDFVGIALPELRIQRFGNKCEDCHEAPHLRHKKLGEASAESPMSSFFQMESDPGVEAAPSEAPQVGEVVADKEPTTQYNGTAPDEPDVVGFVAAAKPPPALSEVPPLPFAPDDLAAALGGHIHVSASIATQEVSGSDQASVASSMSKSKANSSAKDRDDWSNFTASEALHSSNSGGEALGVDGATEALPVASKAPGIPVKDILAPVASESTASPSQAGSATTQPWAPLPVAAVDPSLTNRDEGFLARHGVLLLWLLAISSMALVGGLCLACLGAGFLASFVWQRRNDKGGTRSRVEELPLCRASEVERRLPVSSGYDCTFSKPLSSCQLLRLEALVEGPAAGSVTLTAPLTGQTCVLYSVAVSRQLHDGIRPAPVAFATGGVDFVISLREAPQVRISLRAEDVSLFDMRRGRHVQRKSFASAPDKWQDFVLTHRAGTEWQTSSQMRSDSSSLEFQECTLLCGTVATFVGELHRGSDGTLSLRPMQPDSVAADVSGAGLARDRTRGLSERWRTSWECGGCEAGNVASQPPSPREQEQGGDSCFSKVMASDDPMLLEGTSSLMSVAGSLLWRLPSKFSSRSSWVSFKRGGKRTCSEGFPDGSEGHTL